MNNTVIIKGILLDEDTMLSTVEVCKRFQIPESLLLEMVEYGLCEPQEFQESPQDVLYFNQTTLVKIEAASRLNRDLGINTPGLALVLELLEELHLLKKELGILQHHVKKE